MRGRLAPGLDAHLLGRRTEHGVILAHVATAREQPVRLALAPKLAHGVGGIHLELAHILKEAERAHSSGDLLGESSEQVHLVARPRHLVLEILLLLGDLHLGRGRGGSNQMPSEAI